MSLPYHDRRAIPDHPRGDHLVGPNIGLTLQANRQAVLDVRRTLALARAAGLRSPRHSRHEHWLVDRVHHHVPRTGVARGRVPARFDVFRRRRRERYDDDERLGIAADEGVARRMIAALLVAHQPVSLHLEAARHGQENPGDHRALRPHFLAGIHESVSARRAERRLPVRESVASVRPLLDGRRALQIRGRLSLRDVPVSVAS